jgi:hypothetical protein
LIFILSCPSASSGGCWGSLYVCCAWSCTMQAPCSDDICVYPTSAGLQAFSNTFPARGRPVADILLCPFCVRVCQCSQVISCVLRSLSTCLFAWPGALPAEAALQVSQTVLLHPCLHIIMYVTPCTRINVPLLHTVQE